MQPDRAPLMQVRGLAKVYPGSWLRRSSASVALAGVDLAVDAGRTLAIVGQSGSGKSTLARCMAGLETPTQGFIRYGGRGNSASPEELRSHVQLVFQETASALNPRFTATEIIEEPLRIRAHMDAASRHERALALMDEVGLARSWADARPAHFSGGQQKRLALARALSVDPEVLILDEVFAGLDLSVQAHIANLLGEIQCRRSLALVLISHDLTLAHALADTFAVMYRGRIVDVFTSGNGGPAWHPYTRALLDCAGSLTRAGMVGSR